jgi:hypothetical protein
MKPLDARISKATAAQHHDPLTACDFWSFSQWGAILFAAQ